MKAAQQIQIIDAVQRMITDSDARVTLFRPPVDVTPSESNVMVYQAGETLYMLIVAGPITDIEVAIKRMLSQTHDTQSINAAADAFVDTLSVTNRYHGEIYLDDRVFQSITAAIKHAYITGATRS